MMDHHLVTLYDMQFYANFWEVPDIMEALTKLPDSGPVSYTHLPLPTICSV